MVQAKVSPHLCFAPGYPAWAIKQSEMVLVLGLEIPTEAKLNLDWLLLGPLRERYRGCGGSLRSAVGLFERI